MPNLHRSKWGTSAEAEWGPCSCQFGRDHTIDEASIGWKPEPDGRERWWTGRQWADTYRMAGDE